MNKQTFKSYEQAKAFYASKEESDAVVFCDLAQNKETKEWSVRWEEAVTFINTIDYVGKQLVVTNSRGDVAKRTTNNQYKAAVVGYDASGKLIVVSAHWTKEQAVNALNKFKAGQHVNFNYRKVVGEFEIVG